MEQRINKLMTVQSLLWLSAVGVFFCYDRMDWRLIVECDRKMMTDHLKFFSKYVIWFLNFSEVQRWQKCVIFAEKDRSLATM